ncbi:MAG: regulatory protein RecX [Lachnospiraceae bacterium]
MQMFGIEKADKCMYCLLFEEKEPLYLYYREFQMYELKSGEDLDPDIYDILLHQVLGKRVTKRAMHLLERKDYTEWQLRTKLLKNNYPKEAVDQAIEYVKEYQYVDDQRYAIHYVQLHQKAKNRRKIELDLKQRGISKDIIHSVIEAEYSADEEEQIELLLKKRHFVAAVSNEAEFRRTYQFLMRRGYSGSVVLRKMKESFI